MSESQNPLIRKETQGVTQATNAMGNLFSLNDLLSTTHTIEDLEKIHESQKKLKNDFVSNKEEMRKKLKLLDCENALFIGDATFRKENDMNNFGLIILTEFRFIFEFLEKNSDKEKFKEDFFKIPYLLFNKIAKGEQKSAYFPFTISVRDGRKLLFYLNEKDKTVLDELQARAFPKTFDLFAFPKLLNDNLSNNPKYKTVDGWNVYDFNKTRCYF